LIRLSHTHINNCQLTAVTLHYIHVEVELFKAKFPQVLVTTWACVVVHIPFLGWQNWPNGLWWHCRCPCLSKYWSCGLKNTQKAEWVTPPYHQTLWLCFSAETWLRLCCPVTNFF